MRWVAGIAFALCVAVPLGAAAEKGGNPNKGHGKHKEWSPGSSPGHGKFAVNDRGLIQQYYGRPVGHGHCPPGLAKKNNGCLPPGHAKRYVIGQPLPLGLTWYAVPHNLVVRLTPPPYGYRYVYLDGGVLLLNVSTRLVIDAVTISFH
ncbi:MAG: hypothetical protein ACREIP_04720 [Alphaproteobacteria bacterium]